MLDWPGNSANKTPIEVVGNIMKKKTVKILNNQKKLWNNIYNL